MSLTKMSSVSFIILIFSFSYVHSLRCYTEDEESNHEEIKFSVTNCTSSMEVESEDEVSCYNMTVTNTSDFGKVTFMNKPLCSFRDMCDTLISLTPINDTSSCSECREDLCNWVPTENRDVSFNTNSRSYSYRRNLYIGAGCCGLVGAIGAVLRCLCCRRSRKSQQV